MAASWAIGRKLARAGTACVLAGGVGALMAAGTAQAAATTTRACPAPVISGSTATVTCKYIKNVGAQYWTVPAGVTQATFTLHGGTGAGPDDAGPDGAGAGGIGAEVTGTLPVTPRSVLQVNVGRAGKNSGSAFGGGGPGDGAGGGGASDIRDGAYTLADRLLVAGGGGGGGSEGEGYYGGVAAGGAGGDADSPGGTGASAVGTCGETLPGGGGGGAGTATMGGTGGAGHTSSCNGGNTSPYNGAAGSKGSGGAGGAYGGGGGGGGYYGGGGGAGEAWDEDAPESGGGGGGGGSSYTGTATGASVNDDPASPPADGDGEVVITYPEVLTSHQLSGMERSVSCLTASRCVAVGSRRYHGAVVTLANGAQSHAAVLRGSSVINSVSCRPSGCWAIGHPDRSAGAYLVKISSAGRPAAERTVAVPAGTRLGPISCSSMTSCEVAGADNRVTPAAIEIGTWNGTRLRLYRVRVRVSTQVAIAGISCWHSDCEAVGSAQAGSAGRNLILTITGGKPGTLHTSGYGLDSISCVSATTCYAAGGSALYTVTGGVAASPQTVSLTDLGWSGIECHGSNCEAAGTYAPGSAEESVLVSLTDGTAGSPTYPNAGAGLSDIAMRGDVGFIAIGAADPGTVVIVG